MSGLIAKIWYWLIGSEPLTPSSAVTRSGIGCNALLELMPLYRGTTCELKR